MSVRNLPMTHAVPEPPRSLLLARRVEHGANAGSSTLSRSGPFRSTGSRLSSLAWPWRRSLRNRPGFTAKASLVRSARAYRQGDFGPPFIALAQSVYQTNEHNAALKHQIKVRLAGRGGEPVRYGACLGNSLPTCPSMSRRQPDFPVHPRSFPYS
jgi:hypothetical protein